MIIVVLLSFPDGRTKSQCRQRRQEKTPRSSQRLVLWHSTENTEPSLYLSRIAGFLLREMCNLFHWGVFLSFFPACLALATHCLEGISDRSPRSSWHCITPAHRWRAGRNSKQIRIPNDQNPHHEGYHMSPKFSVLKIRACERIQ